MTARPTLPVFVAGWVIQDGSFPRASVGDIADVTLELHPSGDAPSACEVTRTATATPAYGKLPGVYPDGRLRWLHLLYGNGWSSQYWTDRPTHGATTVTGTFGTGLGSHYGSDEPPPTRGRIQRIRLVHKQVRPSGDGWTTIDTAERLTDIDTVPADGDWWPSTDTRDGDYLATGILMDLDLSDAPTPSAPFVAGALALDGDTVWVMHSSDPILLRVGTAATSPTITHYLLPLTIEPTIDRWTRRIHAHNGVCWLTSEHDIHRIDIAQDGTLHIDRYTTDGAWSSTVHDGQLYLLGHTSAHLAADRRHGTIRRRPDTHPVRVLNENTRRLVPVDRPADLLATRADRATGPDGTQWCVDATDTLRRIRPDGTTSTIDLMHAAALGTVLSTTPNPVTDPDNADLVSRITFNTTHLDQDKRK